MSRSSRRRSEWWLIAEIIAAAFLVLAIISPSEMRNIFFAAMGICAVTGVVLVFMDGPAEIE